MKPTIDRISFGSITIEGEVLDRDVIIRLEGQVEKRKKQLSKQVYGTSHIISLDEAKYVHQDGAERFIVGSGKFGRVTLSAEAADYFEQKGCQVDLLPNKKAVVVWNQAEGAVLGLFHVTC